MPALTAPEDYNRDNLAADLGLARDDPALAAAREEFLLVAARMARCRLHLGPDHKADEGQASRLTSEPAGLAAAEDQDGAEAEDTGLPQDGTDPLTGLSRPGRTPARSRRLPTTARRAGA